MNSIYLHSELDLHHTGHYSPFTLFGVALFTGFFLLFCALAAKGLPALVVLFYFLFLFGSLAYDLILLDKIIPNGHVLFQKGFENLEVEIIINKKTLIRGEIVDFSYWWTNQKLFVEVVCETGQNIILHETLSPWESIPSNWQHSIKHLSADALSYPTFKVKEMVGLLSKEFAAAMNN